MTILKKHSIGTDLVRTGLTRVKIIGEFESASESAIYLRFAGHEDWGTSDVERGLRRLTICNGKFSKEP